MSNPMIDILRRYIEESKSDADTVAAQAKILGISVGTLSQLRHGKPITPKVIEKIAEKLAGDDETRKRGIKKELRAALGLSSADARPTEALEEFDRFLETPDGASRLVCFAYRDIPQTRDAGSYPGYVSADIIKGRLDCALFQPFGPIDKIKERTKEAIDSPNVEAMNTWNYILTLVRGVHEVFEKGKKFVEADATTSGRRKSQIVLYEAREVPSLSVCEINSRLFYSTQQISGKNESRVVQLIRVAGKDKERFVECSNEPAFQTAVAAQFYPIIQYWRSNGRLPVKEDELMPYYGDKEKCPWRIWNEPTS